jgi:hypothetical protein
LERKLAGKFLAIRNPALAWKEQRAGATYADGNVSHLPTTRSTAP